MTSESVGARSVSHSRGPQGLRSRYYSGMPAAPTPDLHVFEHHWQDEADAAFLYRLLSEAEPDEKKSDLYRRLSDVENRHVEIWGKLLREHGRDPGAFRPSVRARLLALLGKVFGPGFLLPMLLAEEGRGSYLDMHRRPRGAPGASESLARARIGRTCDDAKRSPGVRASRGIAFRRAASCGTSCMDSTTASRRTFGLVAGDRRGVEHAASPSPAWPA